MKTKVKFIRPTFVGGDQYKRGDVASFRSRASDAVVTRGDAVYVRKDQPVAVEPEEPKVRSFRDRAREALDRAGVEYDGRRNDDYLRQLLTEHGLEV